MRPLFQWTDRLSIGVPSVDNQHKKLVAMVNEMHAALVSNAGTESIAAILRRLTAYTVEHFRHEEDVMRRAGYPGFAEHKAKHAALVKRVGELNAKVTAGKARISMEVMSFLRDWLRGHISGSDMEIGRFLKANAKSVA